MSVSAPEDSDREGGVVPTLPAGAIPAPTLEQLPPIQRIPKPHCPYCKTRDVISRGLHDGFRYYRCRVCASVETGDWSRFKVLVEGLAD